MPIKQTVINKIAFLGAAICEGGKPFITGVEKAPTLIRESGSFNMIKNLYGADVVDYGDVKQ